METVRTRNVSGFIRPRAAASRPSNSSQSCPSFEPRPAIGDASPPYSAEGRGNATHCR